MCSFSPYPLEYLNPCPVCVLSRDIPRRVRELVEDLSFFARQLVQPLRTAVAGAKQRPGNQLYVRWR